MVDERLVRGMIGVLVATTALPVAAEAQSCPAALTPDEASGPLADVRWLADDALEGRAVGTSGGLCATAYLAARFDALGLAPGGPGGSWLQPFSLRVGSTLAGSNRLAISTRSYEPGNEWIPYGFSGPGTAEGPLVYGGSGVASPGGERPVPATGKILVVEAETPGADNLYSDPHFKGSLAAGRGALAVVILLPADAPLPDPSGEVRPAPSAPVLAVGGAAAAAVREAARRTETARIEVAVGPLSVDVANVLALLPGSDPLLADQGGGDRSSFRSPGSERRGIHGT